MCVASTELKNAFFLVLIHKDYQNYLKFIHSHKKPKNSLEGSLNQVLFAAELDFPKIPVHRLPQNSSNVKTEYAGIYLYFIILILICF